MQSEIVYDVIQNYAMKCRIYPSKSQQEKIDRALKAVQVYHNMVVYDMWVNKINTKEKPKQNADSPGETVHFPDIGAALKKDYKDSLIEKNPIILECPQAALTTDVGLKADLKREFRKNPVEFQKARYYNDLHPRTSYTYQQKIGNIVSGENNKTFRINLAKIGLVKVRGWNQKIRFENEQTDFLTWTQANPDVKLTVTVCVDSVGDYYLIFKLKQCLKPFRRKPDNSVGIDVGIKDIAITSDGKKYENKKFKQKEKRHQRLINRKLSRRWGPSNEVYREARKKNRSEWKKYSAENDNIEKPPEIISPSKKYLLAKKQHAKLNRKISRQRELWNHRISKDIVAGHGTIAVETLNVKGMQRNKHLSYALTDAAFATLLSNIAYKAQWHNRTVKSIDCWTPSSKRCSVCNYIYGSDDSYHEKPWSLSIREWVCPECHTKHDRDINAAKNILYYSKEKTAI